MSKERRWTFGKGHLVVVGDMVDRGPWVTEVLWLVRSLERQAREAGGGVHALLGNHETMIMKGDVRYVNAKYRALPYTVPYLFGPDSEQGRWLRSLPVMVRLGDVLFTHGGISPRFAATFPDLGAVNAAAREGLPTVKATLLGGEGPLWYRGLIPGFAKGAPPTPEEIDAALRTYGARTLVVGHTTRDHVTALHGGRVYAIDSGIDEGRPGELWLQIDGRRFLARADGTRTPLE
jgi:hypothetical protein